MQLRTTGPTARGFAAACAPEHEGPERAVVRARWPRVPCCPGDEGGGATAFGITTCWLLLLVNREKQEKQQAPGGDAESGGAV